MHDQYGFRFWLGWILGFAGSFLLSAVVWTAVFTWQFHAIKEPEAVLGWAIAVFGTWFILITPFMRKKERIWKRLNDDEEKATDAWLQAVSAFVALFVLSCVFWSFFYRDRVFIQSPGTIDRLWLKAVISTWLALILPFLVLLYKRADAIFKNAQARQSYTGPVFRTSFIEKSRRILSPSVTSKLEKIPLTLGRGHVVTLSLKDGRKVPDVFIVDSREILGVYDYSAFDFDAGEVADIQAQAALPPYEESKWLRLDGRA